MQYDLVVTRDVNNSIVNDNYVAWVSGESLEYIFKLSTLFFIKIKVTFEGEIFTNCLESLQIGLQIQLGSTCAGYHASTKKEVHRCQYVNPPTENCND